MKNILLKAFSFMLIIGLLYGCAGIKKMSKEKEFSKVKIKANPEVLQTKAGIIKVNINGSFPEKFFNTKAKMTLNPVLKYDGGQTALKPIILKGEKAEGDGIIIKYTGGSFSVDDQIQYNPLMNASQLIINNPEITFKNKTTAINKQIKLADGVIYTSERIDSIGEVLMAEAEYQEASFVKKSANIYFPYSKDNFDKNLPLNKNKDAIQQIKDFSDFAYKGWKMDNISVNAWASPEGEEAYNENLSKDRATTGQKYLQTTLNNIFNQKQNEKIAILKKQKVKKLPPKEKAPVYQITTAANGEDKEGFLAAVKASNMKDKNAIVNVIESAKNKTEREQKIKDMTVIYSEVESMLAPLRRAELNISYKEPKKSKERIALLSTSKPDSLDSKELLYAATLTKDLNTKLNIYKSVISLYPDNWKGYNNAGCTSFKLGKYDEAGTYFEKANTISPNNSMVLYNLSAIALQKNNLGNAKSYMETAKTQGADINYNLGIILITQGDYEQAMKNFEKNKCSYNMALAQLLLDNITGAKSTLECAEKNADIYYLMAVIGARTSNAQMMNDNLRKAIELNSKFRKEAKKDREFIQFFNNADFMEITKF